MNESDQDTGNFDWRKLDTQLDKIWGASDWADRDDTRAQAAYNKQLQDLQWPRAVVKKPQPSKQVRAVIKPGDTVGAGLAELINDRI
jgi:hypothetical protein